MLLICLILFLLCSCSTLLGQVSDHAEATHGVPPSYFQLLKQHGISPDAASVNEYLLSLTDSAKINQEVAQWIREFDSPKFLQRQLAERSIVAAGPMAIKLISDAAELGDAEVRIRARRCIATIHSDFDQILSAAVGVLISDSLPEPTAQEKQSTILQLLRDIPTTGATEYALQRAVWSIANESTNSLLVESVDDERQSVRVAAILALPKCHTESELVQFQRLLTDRDPMVAISAINAFGFVDAQQSTKHLIRLLESEDSLIRSSAVALLRNFSGKYFGYQYDLAVDRRREAIERWDKWLETAELDGDKFRIALKPSHKKPGSFLISVTGSRVQEFDLQGKLLWESLLEAYDAQATPNDLVVVCERSIGQVRMIDRTGKTLQTFPGLDSPADAQLLRNGNILVAEGSGKVSELSPNGELVREISGLRTPFDVDRLPNGNTLVADSGNDRIVEFDPVGNLIWEKTGLSFPNNVFRMNDGRTLYTTFRSGRVVMLDLQGVKIWEQRLPDATLYSVYCADEKVYVADGTNQKIWELDMTGAIEGVITLPSTFCDAYFIGK